MGRLYYLLLYMEEARRLACGQEGNKFRVAARKIDRLLDAITMSTTADLLLQATISIYIIYETRKRCEFMIYIQLFLFLRLENYIVRVFFASYKYLQVTLITTSGNQTKYYNNFLRHFLAVIIKNCLYLLLFLLLSQHIYIPI